MNKELILRLLTGNIAKLVRYAITAWGAHDAAVSTDWAKLEGAIGIILALAWSIAEDRYKASKAAAGAPVVPTTPQVPPVVPLLLLSTALLTGCATYETTQIDKSITTDPKTLLSTTREVSTTVKARTFWDAKSELAKFRASQTDKTQSTSVGSLSSESTSTNVNAILESVARGAVEGASKAMVPKP